MWPMSNNKPPFPRTDDDDGRRATATRQNDVDYEDLPRLHPLKRVHTFGYFVAFGAESIRND